VLVWVRACKRVGVRADVQALVCMISLCFFLIQNPMCSRSGSAQIKYTMICVWGGLKFLFLIFRKSQLDIASIVLVSLLALRTPDNLFLTCRSFASMIFYVVKVPGKY